MLFNPDASVNIIAFKYIKEICEVNYIPEEDVFTCATPTQEYVFENSNGLYTVTVPQRVLNSFEKKIKESIASVREVQRRLGFASESAVQKCIIDGTVTNLPINTIDVATAAKSADRSIPILKQFILKCHSY